MHDEVAPHRDIQIDYRPISLMVRNEGKNLSEDYQKATPAMQRSFGLLRIIEALRADGKADLVHHVGTPIIAYEVTGEDGSTQWKGYFGPVIPKVVTGQAALQLWDGLSALIQTDGFYELKRTRSVGPDMDSVTLP